MFRPGHVLRLIEARIGSVHNPRDSARGSPVDEVVSLKVTRLGTDRRIYSSRFPHRYS